MERKKFWQIIILLIVFILSVSFPVGSLIHDPNTVLIVQSSIMASFIIFAIVYINITKIAHFFQGRTNIKNVILLLPLFAVAFCNLFYMTVVEGNQFTMRWDDINFLLQLLVILLTAFSEELVFRYIIQKNLRIRSKFGKIMIASSIFALCHILTIVARWDLLVPSSWNYFDLSMIVYTFYVGVCLGFLYEYTNNIVLPIIFHFIFNFVNDLWFYVQEWNIPYFINVLCFAIFGVAYMCLFYFVLTKREHR